MKGKKLVSYKETPIRLKPDFSAVKKRQLVRQYNIFKMLKKKKSQPRILCPANYHSNMKTKINIFPKQTKTERIYLYLADPPYKKY